MSGANASPEARSNKMMFVKKLQMHVMRQSRASRAFPTDGYKTEA
jgi:hypothetical protein